MNKYSVVIWVNGSFVIHSEHTTADAAVKEYFSYASAVLGEAEKADEYHATIKVLDYQLDNYNGLKYTINKTAHVAEAEPSNE